MNPDPVLTGGIKGRDQNEVRGAFWQKYNVSVSGTNLVITAPDGTQTTVALTAGLTQSVVLFAIAKAVVHQMVIKTVTAFAGTAALTATVGKTGTLTAYIASAFNLKTAVSDTQLASITSTTGAPDLVGFAAVNVILALTATTDNLSLLTTGSVDIYINMSVLP